MVEYTPNPEIYFQVQPQQETLKRIIFHTHHLHFMEVPMKIQESIKENCNYKKKKNWDRKERFINQQV
jgi:hypothetical protein